MTHSCWRIWLGWVIRACRRKATANQGASCSTAAQSVTKCMFWNSFSTRNAEGLPKLPPLHTIVPFTHSECSQNTSVLDLQALTSLPSILWIELHVVDIPLITYGHNIFLRVVLYALCLWYLLCLVCELIIFQREVWISIQMDSIFEEKILLMCIRLYPNYCKVLALIVTSYANYGISQQIREPHQVHLVSSCSWNGCGRTRQHGVGVTNMCEIWRISIDLKVVYIGVFQCSSGIPLSRTCPRQCFLEYLVSGGTMLLLPSHLRYSHYPALV